MASKSARIIPIVMRVAFEAGMDGPAMGVDLMDEVHAMSATEATPRRPSRGIRWGHLVATILALGLIGAWVGLWVKSIRKDTLLVGQSTWVPAGSFFAADFKVHIDHVARLQAAGVDPYHRPDDWVCSLYPYPPMLGRSFAWVVLFDTFTAALTSGREFRR